VTTQDEADQRRGLERAREIALFRYSLVQEVISPHLTASQRGRRVRELAAATHAGPGGREVRVSYQSINRWKRAYLDGGFEELVPAPRQASPRTPGEVLDLAAALKRENPGRTAAAAQVQRILRTAPCSGCSPGWS
jgi:putative transposase